MDLDVALSTTPPPQARPRITPGQLFWGLVAFVLKVALILILPFVVLLRTAIYLYLEQDVPTWLALAGGGALALLVLTVYGAWISNKVSGKGRVGFVAKWVALPLVLFYCGYALLHLASVNAKTEEVRSYYTALHPLLRVSVSTFTLLDGDLVITDLARTPQDYIATGLPIYEATLHYRQADGYAHAMDLRTLDRAVWRNWLMQVYFRLMGLRTLRHVGTADHLHVSLPPR